MADVNYRDEDATQGGAPGDSGVEDRELELIELLFFAYRDFTSDPDKILADYGFGRAHHRVIHFVARNPGIRVAELLDILKITKQSLGRVLKQLIDEEFVYQREGQSDRRQRLLFVTDKGRALAVSLAAPQRARIARALEELGGDAHGAMRAMLVNLIDSDERANVTRWTHRR